MFGWVDEQAGRFEPVAFCPGYMRGLSFIGDFAFIGLSMPRDNRTFTGLASVGQESQRSKLAWIAARIGH